MSLSQSRRVNVVALRPGIGDTSRDVLAKATARFNDAAWELDRVLSRVSDRVEDTIRAGRAGIRAGKVAYRQQRQRDRAGRPLGLV